MTAASEKLVKLLRPTDLYELKTLRERVEQCWREMDLALTASKTARDGDEACSRLVEEYREAEARYRACYREHVAALQPK